MFDDLFSLSLKITDEMSLVFNQISLNGYKLGVSKKTSFTEPMMALYDNCPITYCTWLKPISSTPKTVAVPIEALESKFRYCHEFIDSTDCSKIIMIMVTIKMAIITIETIMMIIKTLITTTVTKISIGILLL